MSKVRICTSSGFALRPDDRGVQRLVVVRLGLGDVVVEFARDRRPQVVHDAERRVAVLDLVDQNAHGADVVERVDARLLAAHLVPDAVDVLGAAADFGLDAGRGKLAAQRLLHAVDVVLAVAAALVEQARDALVRLRLERAQGKILELPLQLPDAEAVGERREQVERLARRARAHFAGCVFTADQEAQRLRAFGELDQDDADVLDHGQQHLAQVLRLQRARFLGADAGGGADSIHARGADDDLRDFGAERIRECGGVEGGHRRDAEQDRGAD